MSHVPSGHLEAQGAGHTEGLPGHHGGKASPKIKPHSVSPPLLLSQEAAQPHPTSQQNTSEG